MSGMEITIWRSAFGSNGFGSTEVVDDKDKSQKHDSSQWGVMTEVEFKGMWGDWRHNVNIERRTDLQMFSGLMSV